jgi:DNA-binding PadR family transcriptional regulator
MERELLLLGLLRQANMYGYQLHDFIERYLASCTDLKKSTAYFLLDRMTKQGWIAQHQEQEGNRPPRRVYRVTSAGEAQFRHLLATNLSQHTMARFAGDIGLAFADTLAPAQVLALLEQRRAALADDQLAARSIPRHGGSLQLVVEHRVVHLEAELRWLDEIIARFAIQAVEAGQEAEKVRG